MITDNFAIAIRLAHVYEKVNGTHFQINQLRGKFHVQSNGDIREFKSELEVFQFMASEPDVLQALACATSPYTRGIARRAELRLSMSQEQFDARVAEFIAEGRHLFDTVIAHLGLTVTTKRLPSRATALTKGVSAWYFRANYTRGMCSDKESITVRYFPSPVKPNTWQLQVAMQTMDDNDLLWCQSQMAGVTNVLAAQGITIENVMQCTYMQF